MGRLATAIIIAVFASVGCITVNAPPQTRESTPTSKLAPTAKGIEGSATPTVPSPAAVIPTPTTRVPTPQDATVAPTRTPAPSPLPIATPTLTPAPSPLPPATPILTPTPVPDHDVVDLVARVKPAVVRLSRDRAGMGSGVFFELEGVQRTPYILTNYHVVEGESRVVIRMGDGSTHDGEVIWTDSQRDLAIVTLTCCLESHRLPVGISLAGAAPRDGAEVIAMGFPLGVFTVRTTKGIVASS